VVVRNRDMVLAALGRPRLPIRVRRNAMCEAGLVRARQNSWGGLVISRREVGADREKNPDTVWIVGLAHKSGLDLRRVLDDCRSGSTVSKPCQNSAR